MPTKASEYGHTILMTPKEYEALEKDATRYRWLKINARRIDFAGLCVSDGAQLDARIDAAIRAEAK